GLHFDTSQTLYLRQNPAGTHYYEGQIAGQQPASIPELHCSGKRRGGHLQSHSHL
ncbi:hypothetical protein A2U01_0102993, partial [Trifolium medium]|nr:hypothetical protein [Trifolium medium]